MEKSEIVAFAEKYEDVSFFKNLDGTPRDPAFFMHQYENPCDKEIVALLSASLAFGKRSEILKAIQKILDEIDREKMTPADWVREGAFQKMFPENKDGYFYRTFSNKNLHDFFESLQKILNENESFGEYVRKKLEEEKFWKEIPKRVRDDKAVQDANPTIHYSLLTINCIVNSFNCSPLIPKNATSACKRVCLFLRWMVRKSDVDLGLWTWIDKKDLIIPLDTHVMQSAKKLGIISENSTSATMSQAVKITEEMKKIFGNDPCKADFALFGAEIDGAI